jgi:MFS family permease
LGLIGSVFGIAFIIGPVIAGVILKFLPWNYLFIINLPVAVFIIWRSLRVLPSKKSENHAPIDWKGILLLSAFLFVFAFTLYNISPEAPEMSLMAPSFVILGLFSAVLLFLLFRSERQASDPVVNTEYFRNRQLLLVLTIAAGTGIFQASFVFIPDLAVTLFHVDASHASFMLVPSVIAVAIGAPLWGRLIDRSGSRFVILGGLLFATAGMFLVSNASFSRTSFYLAGILFGFGLSALVGSSLRYVALNEVPAEERATSQGMLTIAISTGQILGSVIIGVIAAAGDKISGFRHAFLFLTGLTCLLALLSLFLKSRNAELATR